MSAVNTPTDTKQALLLAAGELFAEQGFNGACVRDIVAKAETTLSAVNYHFGSKHQLYLETIRYALKKHLDSEDIAVLLREVDISGPQDAANFFYKLVWQFVCTYLAPEHPQWYERLINRAVVDASDEISTTIAEVLRPTDEMLRRVLLEHVPGVDLTTARFWQTCLSGQIHYFLMARKVINNLWNNEQSDYDQEFIEKAADYVARNMVLVLGLPLPEVAELSTEKVALPHEE